MTMILTNEDEARAWIAALPGVSRETFAKLDAYAELLAAANGHQNLVAASTLGAQFWVRHIADSAQLVPLAAGHGGAWIDLGSGPGLPGLIVAILDPARSVRLVESRKLRCAFLREAIAALDLGAQVEVLECRAEALPRAAHGVISARAFAPLLKLLPLARHLADHDTIWLLPKGQNAVNELSTIEPTWQSLFHVEPSVTSTDSAILVGRGLAARRREKWR